MAERLQKIIAQAGLGSRRKAEVWIRSGRVRVNGRPAHIGDKADPTRDQIEVDGRPVEIMAHSYILVNKPRGVLSSTEDELDQGRPTVLDLVPLPGNLYPVGRLDKQSEGLILLTNDGALAHRLTHPRFGHQKVYRVAVSGRPSPPALRKWEQGVKLDGRYTAPARVRILSTDGEATWLEITMSEGRKRQIRRIAALLGHPVERLIREQIGPLRLGELEPGQWRHLAPAELSALKSAVARGQPRPAGASRP
ncbi:MAG: pseudouridine synthase [Candidatus Promineifilaceae bacterium]